MEKTVNIPGINMENVQEQFDGNMENFMKVLRTYMTSTKTKLDLLESFDINNANKESLKQYEITVHGIKGTSRGVCAEQLGNKAAELEKAADAGNTGFIKDNNPAFLEEAREFIRIIEEMFNSIDSKIVRQKKDKPDNEVLKKLAAACDIYDMMEVETAMEEINSYQYDADDGLADWLKQNAEEMNYEAIVERLSVLFNVG